MRDYQIKRSKWYLPQYAYRMALCVVRAYPDIAAELRSDDRRERAVTAQLRRQVDAVEMALLEIPAEYRDGVLDNILEKMSQDRIPNAGRNTWSRWRGRFLYEVAHNLHLV